MYQQPYCLTLPKPFFKIFFFRIYVPTIHSTDIDSDETSVRHPQIPAPTQPHKPIHQRHCPHPPQIPHILHKYHTHTHSTDTTTIQTHNDTDTLDASPPTDVDVDAVAPTLSHSQAGCRRSPIPVRNSTGQAPDRIRLNQTRQDQAIQNQTGQDQAAHSQLNRPGIRQAIYRTRLDQIRQARLDQVRPDRTRPDQVSDRPRTEPDRIRSGQAKPLALHSTRPAGRPPQIFPPNLTAHYSAMRVVQAPSLALTLFDVPACFCRTQARHIVEPAARQAGSLNAQV